MTTSQEQTESSPRRTFWSDTEVLGQPCLSVCVAVLIALVAVSRSGALTFEFVYDEVMIHASDPDASLLTSVLLEAASQWSDIIEDDYTIEVKYWYVDAVMECGVNTACARPATTNEDNSRAVTAIARFSNTRDWYYDPTPDDNEEFTLEQTLYRDLSAANQMQFTGNPVEPLLEVSYRGAPNGSDPNAAGRSDLLSVAFHELGHILGMRSTLTPAVTDLMDGDYDLPPSLLGGTEMGVVAKPDSQSHFNVLGPSLAGFGYPLGTRRLPTATDVLAMAAVSGWTEIDLPRQDFLTGTDWHTPGNWIGNSVPDGEDDAFVRHGDGVTLGQDGSVGSLLIAGGSTLSMGTSQLDVAGSTTIVDDGQLHLDEGTLRGATALIEGTITVDQNGVLNAETTFKPTARVSVPAAEDQLILASTTIYEGGTFTGLGEIQQNGDVTIKASETVTVDVARFDLDGGVGATHTTTLENFSRLIINGEFPDDYDGTLTATAATLEVNSPGGQWTLDGNLVLESFIGVLSRITGTATMNLTGTLATGASGAIIQAALDLEASGTVEVTTNNNAFLRLGGPTNYRGAVITGSGNIRQDGNATVESDQTITLAGVFDMDGSADDSAVTVSPGQTLTLNVTAIDGNGIAPNDKFNGRLTLNSGTLSLQNAANAWEMAGRLTLDTKSGNARVTGSDLNVSGSVQVTGTQSAHLQTPTLFHDFATVEIAETAELALTAPTEFHLAHVLGGKIRHTSDVLIDGGTRVEIDTWEVGTGGELTLEAGLVRLDMLDLQEGTFNFNDGLLVADAVAGDLTNVGGTLAPDTTDISGKYVQAAGGQLEIQIGGTNRGEFDRLSANSAALDGSLEVLLSDSGGGTFAPSAGDVFEVLSAPSGVKGMFDTTLLPTLTGLDWLVRYLPTSVLLEVFLAGIPGDYNDDGSVDAADYVVWRNNLGALPGTLPNDADGGVIGPAQYVTWKANFGNRLGGGALAEAPVPEPASVWLLVLAWLSLCTRASMAP